mgnify:CR=1 FL=1
MKRLFATVVLASMLLVLIPGCQTQSPEGAANGGTPAADTKAEVSGTKTDTQKQAKSRKELTIGVSMQTLGAPYFVAQDNALKKKCQELGIKCISIDAQGDVNKQIADIEDLIAQKVDILILNPKDPKGLIPATKACTKAGIPVIIMDNSIDPEADYVTMVQSNNMKNGELVGEWLGEKMRGTPIKMALLSGNQGNMLGVDRREGVIRGLTEAQLRLDNRTSFTVVTQGWGNWTTEGGLKASEDILVAAPETNVIVAENDSMALGAVKAVAAAGKEEDILICAAADGQKEALELIKLGKYGATGLNNPALVAATTLDIALKYLDSERNIPKLINTPAACITKENVDEYYDPNSDF